MLVVLYFQRKDDVLRSISGASRICFRLCRVNVTDLARHGQGPTAFKHTWDNSTTPTVVPSLTSTSYFLFNNPQPLRSPALNMVSLIRPDRWARTTSFSSWHAFCLVFLCFGCTCPRGPGESYSFVYIGSQTFQLLQFLFFVSMFIRCLLPWRPAGGNPPLLLDRRPASQWGLGLLCPPTCL